MSLTYIEKSQIKITKRGKLLPLNIMWLLLTLFSLKIKYLCYLCLVLRKGQGLCWRGVSKIFPRLIQLVIRNLKTFSTWKLNCWCKHGNWKISTIKTSASRNTSFIYAVNSSSSCTSGICHTSGWAVGSCGSAGYITPGRWFFPSASLLTHKSKIWQNTYHTWL